MYNGKQIHEGSVWCWESEKTEFVGHESSSHYFISRRKVREGWVENYVPPIKPLSIQRERAP